MTACANDPLVRCPTLPSAPGQELCTDKDGCARLPGNAYARGAADERLRIHWWLTEQLMGPASVNTPEAVLDSICELADVIIRQPEQFADAPPAQPSWLSYAIPARERVADPGLGREDW